MMKKSLSARRVPRKIGTDDEIDGPDSDVSQSSASSVKRPAFKTKRSSQVSRHIAAGDEDESTDSGLVTPRRSTLSRIALQRSAGQRASYLVNEIPRSDDESPSYSAADLQALKDSTPTTPLPSESDSAPQSTLDVRDKFGGDLTKYEQRESSAIPSATEIAEKKARRARLALEAQADEYISLDPDNPGWEEDEDGNMMRDASGRLVLREKDKYNIQQSRLVRDDEDVMEGFDDYTGESGSRIAMGASALPQDQQARRNDISAQIANAEGGSESGDSDFDEKSRNAAFEKAQTRRGAFESTGVQRDPYADHRAKTPPNITPLPTMDAVMQRMRATLLDMEEKKRAKEAELERLTREKLKIREEEVRVQAQLQEVAERFRQIKIEKGFLPKEDVVTDTTVVVVETPADDEDDDYDERPTMGLGAARPGLGMTY